jgi:hypothetical protein
MSGPPLRPAYALGRRAKPSLSASTRGSDRFSPLFFSWFQCSLVGLIELKLGKDCDLHAPFLYSNVKGESGLEDEWFVLFVRHKPTFIFITMSLFSSVLCGSDFSSGLNYDD